MVQPNSTTRRQSPLGSLADLLDSIDAAPVLERLAEYNRRGGPKGVSAPVSLAGPRREFRPWAVQYERLDPAASGRPSTPSALRVQHVAAPHDVQSLHHAPRASRGSGRRVPRAAGRPAREGAAGLREERRGGLNRGGIRTPTRTGRTRRESVPTRKPVGRRSNAASGKEETEWHFGYKFHLAVDATYSLPIAGHVTTAKRHDSPEFPRLMERAQVAHSWFRPEYVMADKGYDSRKNHEYVQQQGGALIAPTRRSPSRDKLYEGIYTPEGVPTCVGMVPMEYVKSDPKRGHLYRCRREGCHLRTRQGVRYCADEYWEGRSDDPRLFGPLRRNSPAWKALYRLRWSVERVFKSLKESRRLEGHYIRGLRRIALHASMSTLVYTATALLQIQAGARDYRWMVRRVA